jgi:hypothetical protein
MEDVDREISEMKLSLNARARTVAESYLTAVRASCFTYTLSLTDLRSSVQLMNNPTECPQCNLRLWDIVEQVCASMGLSVVTCFAFWASCLEHAALSDKLQDISYPRIDLLI